MRSHLLARNCALVETGEELYDIVDDPSFFFVPRADADASAETPAAVLPPALLEQRQAELREATERRCGQLAPP